MWHIFSRRREGGKEEGEGGNRENRKREREREGGRGGKKRVY